MAMSDIHSGHRERLRSRYIRDGLESFEDHQVLELLLFYSVSRKDTNELAHRLLDKFGSLSAVFDAKPEELMQVEGIGSNSSVLISMISDLFKRYTQSLYEKKPVAFSTIDTGNYARSLFNGVPYETFYIICFNGKGEVVLLKKLAEGTVDEVAAYPRKVVETALLSKAPFIVLAHNHPGGVNEPSQEDIDVTEKIRAALMLVDVELLDHIVVCGGQYISFKERNML